MRIIYLIGIQLRGSAPTLFGNGHTILTWRGATLTACTFLISVAICAASYRFIEGPLIRIAHRKFRYENPRQIDSDTLTAVSADASSSLP
jgi:peptidoglycan/LPS O-acetylase OafA/YrhL